MRCTNCDYALWNLTARECPECGQPFRPSDYQFVPGTVEFRCPHCRAGYRGDSAVGRPESHIFNCGQCNKCITVDDMIVVPCEGMAEDQTRAGLMPWLDRRKLGWFRALAMTIGYAFVQPRRMIRGVPRNASTSELLTLGGLFVLIACMCGILPALWFWQWQMWYSWSPDVIDQLEFLALIVGSSVLMLGIVPALSILTHAGLRLTGTNHRGLDRTFHAISCSAPTAVAVAVPVIGWLFGWLFWLVAAVIMLREVHGISHRRAGAVVLVPPAILVLIAIGVGVYSYIEADSFYADWSDPTLQAVYAIQNHGWNQGGSGPDHAAELLVTGHFSNTLTYSLAAPFCHSGTRTTVTDISLGDVTLEEFLAMDSRGQYTVVANLLESVPDGLIAHRVGDYVFTYHGGQVNSHDSSFWLIVMLPDPDVNGPPRSSTEVEIALGDMSIQRMTYHDMIDALPAQNAYRGTIGLPPLPDPAMITHASPAVSSGDDEVTEQGAEN